MLQLLCLYLNKDKVLKIEYSVRQRVPDIYRSVAKLLIIIDAKAFNFKIMTSRVGVGNYKEFVNV